MTRRLGDVKPAGQRSSNLTGSSCGTRTAGPQPGAQRGDADGHEPWTTAAQLPAALGMLAGLWVAISPWFVTPRAPRSGNATADDLIIGLAVAAIGLLAITGIRSMAGLQAARLRPASG